MGTLLTVTERFKDIQEEVPAFSDSVISGEGMLIISKKKEMTAFSQIVSLYYVRPHNNP